MAGGGTLVATATVGAECCDCLGLGALDWELAGAAVADAGTRCADPVVVDTGTTRAGAVVVDAGTTCAGAAVDDADGTLCFGSEGAVITVDWAGARLRAAAGAGVACAAGVATAEAWALC